MVSTFAAGIAALSVIETVSLSGNARFFDIIDKHCLTSANRYLILYCSQIFNSKCSTTTAEKSK
jgi:hypothetical protein